MNISTFGLSRIIVLLITSLLLLLSYFGNDVNLVGLFLLFIYLGMVFVCRPIEYINNLLFFIIIVPMLIGGMLIENGVYLFEINKYSYWNGTFIVNMFFSFVFIEFLIYPIKSKKKKIVIKINKTAMEIVIVFAIIILYGLFLKTGIPLLNGTHRTVYFGSVVPEYINLIKGRLSFVCLVLGFYYHNYKSKRYLLYFFLIVLYHILCSIKGGELLIILYTFFLPITLFYAARLVGKEREKINGKIRRGLLLLIGGAFFIIFINYSTVENYDADTTAIEKIEKRIEAAGQIWWVINDESQVDDKLRWDKFIDNFKENTGKFDQGMNELMNVVVPENILNTWRAPDARGRTLANGFPAIGFYYFGYIGVISFIIFIGGVIIFIKKDILTSFESGDILSFLFIGPILELAIRIVAQGDINLFFEKRTYLIFFAYLIYGVIKRVMVRNKKL